MPSILDLFSGCGGLSLGAHKAGFSTALAVDSDRILSSSFSMNFPNTKISHADVRSIHASALTLLLPKGIDGVVGGPPCQAFSEIGRRDAKDPRRTLVLEFFRIVAVANPKFFLFENVRGLGFEKNLHLLEDGLQLLGPKWKIIGPRVLNAADFGAATKRRRLFVFGFDSDEMDPPIESNLCRKASAMVSVRDAIYDLAGAKEIRIDESGFDFWKYDRRRTVSEYALSMRSRSGLFTGHRTTAHTDNTVARFSGLKSGQSDKVGKYVRLGWDGLCPTLRAGTGNDRGSYQAIRPIHPDENRVITPREAARLQGFPDDFLFHPTVWHSCRMIGNSVSPIIAEKLLRRIARHLPTMTNAHVPHSRRLARG